MARLAFSAALGPLAWLALVASLLTAAGVRGSEPESAVSQDAALEALRIDLLYRDAQRSFLRGEYQTALPLLKRFVQVSLPYEDQEGRLFGVLDQIAQILLRELQLPEQATRYFTQISEDPRLNAAERLAIEGWIASSRDWSELGKMPEAIQQPDLLFELGSRYWKRAQRREGSPEVRGDLIISMSYLLRFIRENDADPRVAEALFMVGHARSYRSVDPEYWAVNHYLQGAIQRAPHTPLARRAWQRMHDAIHARYATPPPSIQAMLDTYRKLAFPEE